ncbi:MAG: hypothetical protein QME81_08260 [bacterium]|nr:hypothetical protein [bacterium]
MRKILVAVGFLVILPSLLFAEQEGKRYGVGVNYPGLGLKYGISSKTTLELKAQFGKDILVVGSRYYYNFSSKDKTNLYPLQIYWYIWL